MSIAVMTKVWASYPGAGSELLAMLALADWADDNGNCYPSMSAIAKKIRLSKSQAQRVVHGLIDDGYLKVTANALGGSPTQTRNYRIALDRLTGSAYATGSAGATGRTSAAEGSHPCGGRGSAHATQTISEPSENRQVGAARSPKGSRLPLDWTLPDEYREWCVEKLGWSGDHAKEIAERFADYWHSTTGKSATKADWFATWRNWCRREKSTSGRPAGNSGASVFEGAI